MNSPNLGIFLKLHDQPCLVVGGGQIALRKIRALLKVNAKLTVIASNTCDEIMEMASSGNIKLLQSSFYELAIDDFRLIIAATNDRVLNQAVSALAHEKNIPVNVVDDPELCSFIMPSIVERWPIQIAITSNAQAPILSRLLRAELETMIPSSYGKLARLMGQFRNKAKQRFPDLVQRRHFWEKILDGSIKELVFSGQQKKAYAQLEDSLNEDVPMENLAQQGHVALIGCGPGDPDLLTFRALRLMQKADVVLYDRLVADQIIELVRKDAQRIDVGKQRDQHTLPQEEINKLLVRLAQSGKQVVRLKGGDPFIFGRGGEEIESLSSEGITFQVVPGITAASGCASYAGIPLTHRDYAQSVTFVTGHLKNGQAELNWGALAHENQTIVIYMGLHGAKEISQQLIKHGMSAEMPAALIEQGTTPQQKIWISSLQSLPELVAQQSIKPPTLIIIGQIVELHEQLNWFTPPAN